MIERLTSRNIVRELLLRHGFHIRKKYGQNFLLDENILQKIIAAAELVPEAQVLEIGPGLGTLTRELAARAARVVAVEIDQALKPILAETVGSLTNVELLFEDALKLDLATVFVPERPRYAVANLPYYITSPLLRALLELDPPVTRMVLLVQREVGDRLTAMPSSEAYGSLTVYAQALARVEQVAVVPRQVFYPTPEVESVIVALTPKHEDEQGIVSREVFELTNRALFGQRRKTIANALKGSPHWQLSAAEIDAALAACNLNPSNRGEQLSVAQVIQLANRLQPYIPGLTKRPEIPHF